jgi:hypothetical protein
MVLCKVLYSLERLRFLQWAVKNLLPSGLREIKVVPHRGGGAVIDRAKILKAWIEKEGRKQSWVAQQVECSPQWLNYVLRGKKPLSDRLAYALQERLGVPLVNIGQVTEDGCKRRSKPKRG